MLHNLYDVVIGFKTHVSSCVCMTRCGARSFCLKISACNLPVFWFYRKGPIDHWLLDSPAQQGKIYSWLHGKQMLGSSGWWWSFTPHPSSAGLLWWDLGSLSSCRENKTLQCFFSLSPGGWVFGMGWKLWVKTASLAADIALSLLPGSAHLCWLLTAASSVITHNKMVGGRRKTS